MKRKEVSKHRISLVGLPRSCGRLFLDSGAHSLYNLHAQRRSGLSKFTWFAKDGKLTKRFRKAIDRYAEFVKANKDCFDLYATLDVIFNPELSWKSYRYLVREHGLRPMPVVHFGTGMEWVDKYLNAGCKYLGVGGIGQEANRYSYVQFADRLFKHIGSKSNGLPCVKTHGFAMTSVPLMVRWPWFSVDSSRWAKAAGNGSVLIPHKRDGKYTFDVEPYLLAVSHRSTAKNHEGQHYDTFGPEARRIIREWFTEEIDVPFGKVDREGNPVEYGVYSQYNARAVANLKFFERLAASIPTWPWPFKTLVARGLHE